MTSIKISKISPKARLVKALDALEDAPQDALALLIDVWVGRRDARLALLIEHVGELVAEPRELPTDASWDRLALGNDPSDVTNLVTTATHGRLVVLAERIDPRVSRAVFERLRVPDDAPWTARWKPLFEAMMTYRDPRWRARRDEIELPWRAHAATLDDNSRAKLESAIERLLVAMYANASLEPEEHAIVDQMLARFIAPPGETEAALLAAIYAAPDEDGPREVYADWLIENGDPARGEFITRQLTAHREKPELGEVVEDHPDAWAEPLRRYLHTGSSRYERGFVSRACIASRDPMPPPMAAWATVEDIYDALPISDQFPMPALQRATLRASDVVKLAALREPPPLYKLTIDGFYTESDRAALRTALATLRLPHLAKLEMRLGVGVFEPTDLAALIKPIGPIERLEMNIELPRIAEWGGFANAARIPHFIGVDGDVKITLTLDNDLRLTETYVESSSREPATLVAVAEALREMTGITVLSIKIHPKAWNETSTAAIAAIEQRYRVGSKRVT